MTTLHTPPLFTHWLWWADSELVSVVHEIATPERSGGWQLRLSAARVGRSLVPVAAPPTGVQAHSVEVGTVTGVVLRADALPGTWPTEAPVLAGCLGRIAQGRWTVAANGTHQTWWPLVWGDKGSGSDLEWPPPPSAGELDLAFSNGSALRLRLAGLRAELPLNPLFHESMAC